MSSNARQNPKSDSAADATDVRRRVEEAIHLGPYGGLRRVACQWSDGTAVLTGRVPSYFVKQIAQDRARRVAGVDEVVNHIEVDYSLEPDSHP